MTNDEIEARCLALGDPLAGGGETHERTIEDRFLVGRKEYVCAACGGAISKGARHRLVRTVIDHEWVGGCRYCWACSEAQALDDIDLSMERFIARLNVGYWLGAQP